MLGEETKHACTYMKRHMHDIQIFILLCMLAFLAGEQQRDYMCHPVYYVNYLRYNTCIFFKQSSPTDNAVVSCDVCALHWFCICFGQGG